MSRNRVTRVLALLVLILAQGAFGLPHRMTSETVATHAQSAGSEMAHEDCHHGAGRGDSPADTHMPPCGSCPASMPGSQGGGCLDMATCGPAAATPGAPTLAMSATVPASDSLVAISAPAAHDFIPDPPPPRA